MTERKEGKKEREREREREREGKNVSTISRGSLKKKKVGEKMFQTVPKGSR